MAEGRALSFTANEGGQIRVSLGRELERGSIDVNAKPIDDSVIFYTGLPLMHDADGDITGIPGIDAKHDTLTGPETRSGMLLDANDPRPLRIRARHGRRAHAGRGDLRARIR